MNWTELKGTASEQPLFSAIYREPTLFHMYVYSVIFFLFLDFFLHFYFSFSLCHLPSSNENWTGSIRSYQKGSIHRDCGLYMLLFHLVCDRFSGISHVFNHQWSNNKWRCKYLTPIYPPPPLNARRHAYYPSHAPSIPSGVNEPNLIFWISLSFFVLHFLFLISAQRLIFFQRRSTQFKSIFPGEYLFKLLPYIMRSHDTFLNR